jgi:hypothetical protein
MGKTAVHELTRDELICLVNRLRRVLDVRDLEIAGLEQELERAQERLAVIRRDVARIVAEAHAQTARLGGCQLIRGRDTERREQVEERCET